MLNEVRGSNSRANHVSPKSWICRFRFILMEITNFDDVLYNARVLTVTLNHFLKQTQTSKSTSSL